MEMIDIRAFDTDAKRCLLLNCLAQKANCGTYILPDDKDGIKTMGDRMRLGPIEHYGSKNIKVNLSGDTFNPGLFDRDFGGNGTAARLINKLLEFIDGIEGSKAT